MDVETGGADFTWSGTGQQTASAENDTSGQRCDSIQSPATSTASVAVQGFADANRQNTVEESHDAEAAAALVQMYGTSQRGMHTNHARWATGSQSFPAYSHQQQDTFGPSQSRSYEGAPMYQTPAQYNNSTVSAYNVQHDPNTYSLQHSDADLRNTVMTLSRAFTTMQEQQSDIQQKQEHLTSALTDLTVILQSMKSNTGENGSTGSNAGGNGCTTSNARENGYMRSNARENGYLRSNTGENGYTESTLRALNIPFGRDNGPQPSTRGHCSQLSRSVDNYEVRDNNRGRSLSGTGQNRTGGETQFRAEADTATLQQYPYQYQNQDQQLQTEAPSNQQDGNSIYREYRYQGSAGCDPVSRAEWQNTQAYDQSHQRQDIDEEVSVGWRDYIPPRRRQSEGYRRSQYENRATIPEAKLPPFSGKEEWKVWVSRFEAVAERRKWDEDAKLDNLLPRLQGKAGEFVFSQLPSRTLSNYEELVRELNSRFRVVETQKTFAAKFSQRNQRNDETVEEYAADLKRLYAKAYRSRDEKTRQEDLVRRFLDGLKDHEARFEIEFHKEPDDIDNAVYHAVNFLQTRRRSSGDNFADRKFKRYARRTSQESDSESEVPEQWEEDESHEQAKRLPVKEGGDNQRRRYRNEKKTDVPVQKSSQEMDSLKVLSETKELVQTLVSQIADLKKPDMPIIGKPSQKTQLIATGVTCYSCRQKGHIARDCPDRNQSKKGGPGNSNYPEEGKKENKPREHLNY